MQLEACHSPKDKAAVLVAAHKVVVGAFPFPSSTMTDNSA